MNLAPVVLFVYNRPWHTQQTVEALQENELANESELFIYSDDAKNDDARESVDEVREYIQSIGGFKRITIIMREENWGVDNSVIDGVTKIISEYGKIIVLEDDLVTSSIFLKYMNEALEKYQDDNDIYSITGYSFSNDIDTEESTYFLKITSSWSWATWDSKWLHFSQNKDLLTQCLKNKYKFNYDNSFNYIGMLTAQLKTNVITWDIHWYASVFLRKGLTLYPSKSLVKNIGFDGSGVHCGVSDKKEENYDYRYKLTEDILEKKENRAHIVSYFNSQKKSLSERLMSMLKRNLPSKIKGRLWIFLLKIKLLFFKKDIGKGSYIDPSVNVFGWSHVCIGSNTLVGEQSWLNVNGREEGFNHIKIGNYCYIGRRNLLSSSRELIISDYVMTNNECKFLGSNHIFDNPLKPYISTGTTNNEIQKIGINCWIGAGTIVLGAVEIGYGSIIGAGSVVTKDIPPFSIAVGNPCRVIKRYDFDTKAWLGVEMFDSKKEALIPNEELYLKELQESSKGLTLPVMAATSKYGDLY